MRWGVPISGYGQRVAHWLILNKVHPEFAQRACDVHAKIVSVKYVQSELQASEKAVEPIKRCKKCLQIW